MKNYLKSPVALMFCCVFVLALSSCQKLVQTPSKTVSGSVNTSFATNQSIVIAKSSSGSTLYAVNTCRHGDAADSIAFTSLTDSTKLYLAATYPGYIFKRAYKILTHAGVVEGYVVFITFNGNPVALKFKATGGFTAVLEQREDHDLDGPGWHEGGIFGDRDGHHRDTIAITTLPAAIITYMTTNYPTDTLKHAMVNKDSSYVVISADNGVFATEFSRTGTFIERVQIYPHVVRVTMLTQAILPPAISSYLSATYPAYVFDNAFQLKLNGVVSGYLVVIDANSTKYLLIFNGSGGFERVHVIR
jgi:hypothetical protein